MIVNNLMTFITITKDDGYHSDKVSGEIEFYQINLYLCYQQWAGSKERSW